MPWLVIRGTAADDPIQLAQALLEGGQLAPLDDGAWILTLDTESDRARLAHRERQRRYRRRRSVTRDATAGDASDGQRVEDSSISRRDNDSLSALKGQERVSHPGNGDESDASRVTLNGDARDAGDDRGGPGSDSWRLPQQSDAEREAAQRRIRELRDELHATRADRAARKELNP